MVCFREEMTADGYCQPQATVATPTSCRARTVLLVGVRPSRSPAHKVRPAARRPTPASSATPASSSEVGRGRQVDRGSVARQQVVHVKPGQGMGRQVAGGRWRVLVACSGGSARSTARLRAEVYTEARVQVCLSLPLPSQAVSAKSPNIRPVQCPSSCIFCPSSLPSSSLQTWIERRMLHVGIPLYSHIYYHMHKTIPRA